MFIVAEVLHKRGVRANHLSLIGLLLSFLAAIAYYIHSYSYGLLLPAFLLILAGFCDVLDGVLARVSGTCGKFGSFLDSVVDRASDGAILLGILLGGLCNSAIIVSALILMSLVSYVKAKGEALGVTVEGGVMERAERLLVIIGATFIEIFYKGALEIGILIIAVFSFLTVLQRGYKISTKLLAVT